MKTLNLTFKGSLGKAHTMKLKYANDNLDEATVRAAMDQISKTKLFVNKDGEELYATPVSAKYVMTTDEWIIKAPTA